MSPKMNSCRSQNHFMSLKIAFHVADIISCRWWNFMSPIKWFHVADGISCRQKLTHVRAKMISCRQNVFHVTKTISCHQKSFSCRRKLDFMSPIWFHVGEKVDFPDVNRERLCGTNAFCFSGFRKVFWLFRPPGKYWHNLSLFGL